MFLPTWSEQAAAHAQTYGEEPTLAAREFLQLANYFEHHKGKVVSFEVLPAALKPDDGTTLLVDGSAVAITKGDLVKAFVYARNTFFGKGLDAYGSACCSQAHTPEKEAAARIMLLFDPEHLTASNYLKKRLLSISQDDSEAVHYDLVFLESVLTSPLHKHSKSPTLWYHRYWLVKMFKYWEMVVVTRGRSDRVTHTSYKRAQFSHDERMVVLKAAERHAMNYHAFQYFRRLWEIMWSDVWIREWHYRGDAASGDAIKMVTRWCKRHPTDISGWSFLVWICCQPNPSGSLSKTRAYHHVNCTERWRQHLDWHGAAVEWFIVSMKLLSPTYFPRSSACTVGARRIGSPVSEERMANRRGLIDGPKSAGKNSENNET